MPPAGQTLGVSAGAGRLSIYHPPTDPPNVLDMQFITVYLLGQ